MKNNNRRAVAINSQKLDELYKEWSGEHHTTNSNKPVHDSAECCDFAEYCLKYGINEEWWLNEPNQAVNFTYC